MFVDASAFVAILRTDIQSAAHFGSSADARDFIWSGDFLELAQGSEGDAGGR